MSNPIVVSSNVSMEQMGTAIRQVAPAIVTYMVAKNYLDTDLASMLTVLLGAFVPIIWAQLTTWERSQTIHQLVNAVPDEIAKFK